MMLSCFHGFIIGIICVLSCICLQYTPYNINHPYSLILVPRKYTARLPIFNTSFRNNEHNHLQYTDCRQIMSRISCNTPVLDRLARRNHICFMQA